MLDQKKKTLKRVPRQKDLKGSSSLKSKKRVSEVPDCCLSGIFPKLLRGGVLFKYLFRRMCTLLMQERFPFPFTVVLSLFTLVKLIN